MGQLNIRIDDRLKEAFIKKAKECNTSATELLIEYIKQYLTTPYKNKLEKIEELERRLAKVEQVLWELVGYNDIEFIGESEQ